MPPPLAETAPRLSPRDMVNRFRHLLVPQTGRANGDALMSLPSGISFELNNYLCNNAQYGGAVEALKLKDLLLNIPWGTGPHPPNLRTLFNLTGIDLVNVFTGKGTPDQMERTLSFVDFVIREKPQVLRRAFPALVEGGIAYMQDMAVRGSVLIGLDCNGFVGNWQMAAGYNRCGPNDGIQWWPNRRVRTRLADVHTYDVAPFANNSHIVALHRVYEEGGKKYADIAQSTGRVGSTSGPQFSQAHEIRATNESGVFTIHPSSAGFNPIVFAGAARVRILATGFCTV